jgi:hypothetical protein
VNGARRSWWLAGVALGVLFVLFNLVELAFVDGDGARDLVGIGLGALMIGAALVRYRGWEGS